MDTDLFDILCNIDQCRHLIPEGSYIDLCRSLKRIHEKLKAEKKKASQRQAKRRFLYVTGICIGLFAKLTKG